MIRAASEPLVSHCMWVRENAKDEEVLAVWEELESHLDTLESDAEDVAFADDAEDVDILGTIGEIAGALEEALKTSNEQAGQEGRPLP